MNPLDPIIEEYVALKADTDAGTKRLKELREQILTHLPDGGPVGNHKVTVSRPRTVDWKKVEASFPAEAYPQIWKALDRDAVKQFVAPAVLEDFMVESSPRMTVK